MSNEQSHLEMANGLTSGHGVLCYWKYSGTAVTPDDLREMLNSNGLGSLVKYVKDINKELALKSACSKWSFKGSGRSWKARLVGGQDGNMRNVSLMEFEEKADSDGSRNRGDFVQKDVVVFNVSNGEFDTSLMHAGQIGQSDAANSFMISARHRMQHLDGNYIRERVVYPMFKDALQIGGGGTFYLGNDDPNLFVLKTLKDVLKPIGFNLYICCVQSSPDWNEAIADSTVDLINSRLGEMNKKIDGWEKSTRAVRSDGEEGALASFMKLNNMAAHVEANLGRQLEDLKSRIQDMKVRAEEIIDGKRKPGRASTKTKPIVVTPNVEAIAAWPRLKIEAVWGALLDGQDCPEDPLEAALAIASAMS